MSFFLVVDDGNTIISKYADALGKTGGGQKCPTYSTCHLII